MWFFNCFSVVATLLHFVVSIRPPLAVSCYCNSFEYQGLPLIIVSLGNIMSLHLEGVTHSLYCPYLSSEVMEHYMLLIALFAIRATEHDGKFIGLYGN